MVIVVGWVGLGQSADGLGRIGSHKMDPWTTLYSAHGIPTIHAVPFWLNQTQQTTTNWGKGVNQTWPIRDYPSGVGGFNWDQGANAPLPRTCPRPNKFQERPSGTSRIQETFSGHRWGAYSAAVDPLAGGWRLAFLPQEPHPGCRPVGHLASGLTPTPLLLTGNNVPTRRSGSASVPSWELMCRLKE